METTFFIWAIPFFVVSAFHLTACFTEKNRAANASKKLLMFLLIIAVIGYKFFSGIDFNELEAGAISIIGGADGPTSIYLAGKISPNMITILLCIALFCGALGDIFLLGKIKDSNFLKGMGSFFAGHLIYITILLISFSYILQIMPIPLWFVITALIVYALVVVATWLMNKKPKGAIGIAVIVYAIVLVASNYITLLLCAGYVFSMFSVIPPSLILIFCGSALFLISDAILSHTIFVDVFPKHRFFVMLTYIAAQFFIAWGICTI